MTIGEGVLTKQGQAIAVALALLVGIFSGGFVAAKSVLPAAIQAPQTLVVSGMTAEEASALRQDIKALRDTIGALNERLSRLEGAMQGRR
jgi:ubiquinone biosynthesis protein UbiJ